MGKYRDKIIYIFIGAIIFFFSIPVIHFSAAIYYNLENNNNKQHKKLNQFGFISESLVETDSVAEAGDTFRKIVRNFNLPTPVERKVISEAREFLDGFTSGDIYRVYANAFDPEELQYLVFEKDPINYVVVELKDSVNIYTGQKDHVIKRKRIDGVIKTSFYHSLKGNDLHPELITKLSEIYQWQIDFHRLRKGDNFRFIIEEKFIGDSLIGEPKIAAAYFNHAGEDFYAIRYKEGEVSGYYDLSGKNVKKHFLKTPVEFSTVTSPYSDIRYHPILKINKPHFGTDYAAPEGTPVQAVADGIVTDARFAGGNGNFVRIIHDETYSTQYLHMSGFAEGIKPGKAVRQGDVIGYVGSTGLATGPHVCFRFWKDGVQVDPAGEKISSNYQLKGESLGNFITLRDTLLTVLEKKNFIDSEMAAVTVVVYRSI